MLTVRRLASPRSCQDPRQGGGRNESPVNEAGRWRGWGTNRRVGRQTDRHGERRRGAMTRHHTHSLEKTGVCRGWGGVRPRQHHPTPTRRVPRAHRDPGRRGAPGAGPGTAGTTYSTRSGRPGAHRRGSGDGALTETLPLAALGLSPPTGGRCVAAGASQAPHWAVGVLLPPRAQPHHMTAQRLRRSAPWKRRAACTCLQRAQPTLLSSSLKSSRMCQLYLAEHST